MKTVLSSGELIKRIDIGCAASFGHFHFNIEKTEYEFFQDSKATSSFIFNLISKLQFSGTVPIIDILAYSKWSKTVSRPQ